jgi:metal-responsive CopG/Arc/MetJ family transcriptional regulator
MMEIVSISLDADTLKELNQIQDRLGFRSRSKMIRSTIDLLLNEYKVIDALKGVHEVAFVITYKEGERDHVSAVLHRFESVIRTTIHQHQAQVGLDILNVEADAAQIRELFGALKRNRCIKSVNFIHLYYHGQQAQRPR